MNRPILASAFFALAATALMAQDASQSTPYQGTSSPPPDDSIKTSEQEAPIAKPPAGHPLQPAAQPTAMQPTSLPARQNAAPVPQTYGDGTDQGIVGAAPSDPTLATRPRSVDPDSDIVHPAPLPPGTLAEGTMIRVRLLDEVSSSFSASGEPFRSRVSTDVLQDGQIVIPAGAEIDGKVAEVSTGHLGGHGSILLQPETVTLENGSKYQLHAVVRSTPGSHLRVGSEGLITPGSRVKRDGVEYGGVVGGSMITGALLGGPAGMVAGGIIGAGVVTTHLLLSHPQAGLKSGAVLMFTLTDQVQLVPAATPGN